MFAKIVVVYIVVPKIQVFCALAYYTLAGKRGDYSVDSLYLHLSHNNG